MIYYNNNERLINKVVDIRKKTINQDFPTHWHNYYEIEYVIKGSGDYVIDGVSHKLEPGMIFFLTPLNFHSLTNSDVLIYNASFIEGICSEKYLSRLTNLSNIVFKAEGQNKIFFDALFEELFLNKDNQESYTLYLDCIISKLGQCIVPTLKPHTILSQNAIHFILTNFRSSITLNDVAAFTGFTPTYFSEIFKKQTGTTFKSYLQHTRLEYARKLILFSTMSIQQICHESGFNDYNNFIRKFKQKYGNSPTQYKKNYNKH